MKIDMSLTNAALYAGCEITEVAGRLNLTTPVADAVNVVGRNVAAILAAHAGSGGPTDHDQNDAAYYGTTYPADWSAVTLTGPMAVWAYLVAFHAVVHRFAKVFYDDGRTGPVLVAAHG